MYTTHTTSVYGNLGVFGNSVFVLENLSIKKIHEELNYFPDPEHPGEHLKVTNQTTTKELENGLYLFSASGTDYQEGEAVRLIIENNYLQDNYIIARLDQFGNFEDLTEEDIKYLELLDRQIQAVNQARKNKNKKS